MDRSIAIAHALRWPIAIAWCAAMTAWSISLAAPIIPPLKTGWDAVDLHCLVLGRLGVTWYSVVLAAYVLSLAASPVLFMRPRRGWLADFAAVDRLPRRARWIAAAALAILASAVMGVFLEADTPWSAYREHTIMWVCRLAVVPGTVAIYVVLSIRQPRRERYESYYHLIARIMLVGVLLWLVVVPLLRYSHSGRIGVTLEPISTAADTLTLAAVSVVLWSMGAGSLLLFALVPFIRWRSLNCMACGYDLRATIEHGHTTCPECGREIEAPRIAMSGKAKAEADAGHAADQPQ